MTNISLSQLVSRARSNEFLRHNAIFFTGSLVVSVLNYAYYPVLGRLLPPAQFGEVQALVSLFLQATIFLSVVTNVAVNVVANEKRPDIRSRIVIELERLATMIVFVGVLISLAALPWLQGFLRFEEPLPFIVLGLALLVSAPIALRTSYLRGMNAFGPLSVANILAAGFKIVASALLVFAGLGTAGAIGGLVVAQLIALAYAVHYARRLGLQRVPGRFLRRPNIALVRPQLPYAGLVLVVSLVTTMQFSVDILIIKHYFSAEVAGAYAGIATVARIIYFLTGSIAAVLLSTVKIDSPKALAHGLLLRSIVLQTALGGVALAIFALVPSLIISLLIGSSYLGFADLLPELSLAMFVIAFINLLLTYDLALRRASSAVVAVLGAAITFGLVLQNHATPHEVVRSLLIGSSIMLALRLVDSLRRRLPHARTT